MIGTGSGLAMAPTTAMIMSAVPLSRAGMGSAVNDTAREVGGAAGIAVLGSVLATRYRSGVTDTVERLPGAVGEAVAARSARPSASPSSSAARPGSAVADAARGAFVDAMAVGLRVGALTALVAAAVVARLLPAGDRHPRPGPVPAAAAATTTQPPRRRARSTLDDSRTQSSASRQGLRSARVSRTTRRRCGG